MCDERPAELIHPEGSPQSPPLAERPDGGAHSVVPDRDARCNRRITAAALLGKVDDDIAQLVFEAGVDALQP